MKKIALTQEKFALVDDEDFEWLNQWKWSYDGNNGYAKRTKYTKDRNIKIYMHRIILNIPQGLITDHINRNRLDNRKDNLRISNKQQNGFNRDKNKNNISGFKGVTWHHKNKKWIAQIMINGINKYLGSYQKIEDAIKARNTYDKKLGVI